MYTCFVTNEQNRREENAASEGDATLGSPDTEGASERSIRPAHLLKDMKSRVDLGAREWFSNNEHLSIFSIPEPTW